MVPVAKLGSCMALSLAAGACLLPSQAVVNTAPMHTAPMMERYGKPYVMVTINNRGPYKFVIDTGTGADAFVSPQLADELALPNMADTLLNDPSGRGSRRVPTVQLDSIRFAGVEFSKVTALRHEVTGEAGACQGLLGFTLFRNYLLTLDFPNRQVLLAEGRLKPDEGKTVLPFRMPDGVPIASLRIDGHSAEAQFDSGGGGLTLPEELAAHQRWEISPVIFAWGQTLATRFEIKAAKLAADVKVGKYTFDHPVVEIHPAFPLVNFGSPPMQSFAITFDQKSLLLRLTADRSHFNLTAPPSPTRLSLEPAPRPTDVALVPVG